MPAHVKRVHHDGVYAIILNADRDHILLIRKRLGAYTKRLDLPGGRVEAGESDEEALDREVFEETGCSVNIQKPSQNR